MSDVPYTMSSQDWPGLAKLAEECGELVQVIGRIIQGYHPNGELLHNLIDEMGDVRASLIFVCESNGIPKKAVHDRADIKLEKYRGWRDRGER